MAVTKVINLLALVSVAFALECNTCYDYSLKDAATATALKGSAASDICSDDLTSAACAEGSVCYTSKMTFTMDAKSYTATAGYCAAEERDCDTAEKQNLEGDTDISSISALKCVVSKCEKDGCNSAMANGVPTLLFAATVFFFLGRI